MARPETPIKLEARVAVLEAKVEQLQRKLKADDPNTKPWWEDVVGAFADDPAFEEAMRLGREYRESLRPKVRPKPRRAKSAGARKR
jgi:hypothetical protein